MAKNKLTIIVPVYGDWPSLKECIESLQQTTNADTHNVILANDCGPEADKIEANILKLIKGQSNFRYVRNEQNLGFVGNCNNAVMNLDSTKNDIVLLNSDTKVTPGAFEEMAAVLASDERIATVSPRSNNATICTFPLSAIHDHGIEASRSFRLFERQKQKLPRYSIAPTGHGFCLMIRRSVIKKYGLFDTAFGKGYGEEVDFCRRVQKHGWKSVIAHHAYVFHLEARSFSLETKAELIMNSRKIIEARYPEYKSEVTQYIQEALTLESRLFGSKSHRLKQAVRVRAKRLLRRP